MLLMQPMQFWELDDSKEVCFGNLIENIFLCSEVFNFAAETLQAGVRLSSGVFAWRI